MLKSVLFYCSFDLYLSKIYKVHLFCLRYIASHARPLEMMPHGITNCSAFCLHHIVWGAREREALVENVVRSFFESSLHRFHKSLVCHFCSCTSCLRKNLWGCLKFANSKCLYLNELLQYASISVVMFLTFTSISFLRFVTGWLMKGLPRSHLPQIHYTCKSNEMISFLM